MSAPSDIPHKKVKLNPEDVPGATLKYKDVNQHSVLQLRRFLKCRGENVPKSALKMHLVERVKTVMKADKPVDSTIDDGVWIALKENSVRRSDLSNNSNQSLIFPTTTWKSFPSHKMPKMFSFGAIYNYLIETATIEDENQNLVDFETAKPFNRGRILFKSGFVTNLKDTETICDKHYCIKSDVFASMRKKTYKVLIMLENNTGKVLDASCECKASTMARCSHVSGVLFAIEDFMLTFGSEPESCTSKLCEWNKPRQTKNSTEVMKNQYTNKRNFDIMLNFKPDLTPLNPREVNNTLLRSCEAFSGNTMWELLLEYNYENYALTNDRRSVLLTNIHLFQLSLKFNLNAPGEVYGTHNQSGSERWLSLRRILITASCCTNFSNINDDNIFKKLKNHMFGVIVDNDYTRYGKESEKFAIADYVKKSGNFVTETGLWINPDYPGLGASPDGLVVDNSSKTLGLLEIKCPFVLRKFKPQEIHKLKQEQKQNFCATLNDNNELILKRTHKYYMQVQMQMGICNKTWCDFVIWSKFGINIERIYFDASIWANLSNKLMDFHFSYICPEYFERRIPRKLVPFKLTV